MAPLAAQDFSRLPDWAQPHALAASTEPAPAEADAWVLFERTEVAYAGDGEIRTRRLMLVKVLSERALGVGVFTIQGLGGKASRVKRLKGWNLRPDGEVTKLDQDRVVTVDNASDAEASTDTLTAAALPRVAKGSLVAFESLQIIEHPMGPVAADTIMGSYPIRRWELEPAKQEGWFTNLKKVEIRVDRRHFEPWLTNVSTLGDLGLAVDRVPALPKDEAYHPAAHNVLPSVNVRFLDPDLKGMPPWNDWNANAAWMHTQYAAKLQGPPLPELKGKDLKADLQALTSWMARELHYRQVYLSPERGWIPLDAAEVGRRKYGDCKDLSCFLMTQVKQLGAEVRPALARIMAGVVEPEEPPSLGVFNHVIAAIHLDRSLGFAAEVDTAKGRFLLIDPTDRFTPLGLLGEVHRDGRVLICTPEGGLWVSIPASAIHSSSVQISLRGEVDGKGSLKASMMIVETGDAWGMRAVAQARGAKQLRDYVLGKLVDLPPTATLEIIKMGDPMDLDKPFSTEIELRHPEGFRRSGNEAVLAPLGWRILPSQAQKPGIPRRYPLLQLLSPGLDYSAVIQVPFKSVPVMPSLTGTSPFRAYAWSAAAEPEGIGTRLTLHLRHDSKQAFFDFDRREEGVAAAKKDRAHVKNLLADALAFKVSP
jgi:hypothetical protein